MWSRRSTLRGGALLMTAVFGARRALATEQAPGISAADFAARPGDAVLRRSAGYDEQRPFLFEGLEPRFATRAIRSCFIRMRDGVGLSTDFHIPLGAPGPLPVILTRTPYGKRNAWPALQKVYPEQGFIYAVQDVRGRHESEGVFLPGTGQDRDDGYDTLTWIAAQPWCNGSIGATGTSYGGETAAKLAATNHPAHKASIIMFDGAYAGGAERNGAYLQNGITMLRDIFEWFRLRVPAISYGPPPGVDRQRWFRSPASQVYSTQPVNQPVVNLNQHLKTLPMYSLLDRIDAAPSEFANWMVHSANPDSPYWEAQNYLTYRDRFTAPALHVTGPQEQAGSGPYNFHLFRDRAITPQARDHQHLLFSPAPHSQHAMASADSKFGARSFGDTRYPYYQSFVKWFGYWLRGDANDVGHWPKVTAFIGGKNRWETMADYPPPETEALRLYLHNAAAPPGAGPKLLRTSPPRRKALFDSFRYDPADPTPSEPAQATRQDFGSGYYDRSSLESRSDILVYTTSPLKEDLELAGKVQAVLHVSSSAKDTDFVAILLDVDQTGKAVNITHGAVRMRFREGLDRSILMEPGKIYEARIDMWFAAFSIPAGNRIRLHVASAHFPQLDRNLNTGGHIYEDTDWVVAENNVHLGQESPSYLVLPVRKPTRLVL